LNVKYYKVSAYIYF